MLENAQFVDGPTFRSRDGKVWTEVLPEELNRPYDGQVIGTIRVFAVDPMTNTIWLESADANR